MRIAFILNGFPYLTETFIINQITGLLDLGHEIDIFAHYHPHQPKIHPDVHHYHLMQKVHYLPPILASRGQRLKQVGLFLLTQMRPRHFRRFIKLFTLSRTGLKLTALHKAIAFLGLEQFDLFYCHYGTIAKEYFFLRELFVRPFLTKFYGFDVSSYTEDHGTMVYERLFHEGDLFLAIGNTMKARLMTLGCPREKIRIHHMGVEPTLFEYIPRKVPENGNIKLLTLARFVEKKGLQYAIQAVARALKKYSNIEYTIVGDGVLRDEIQSLVTNLGAANNIHLVGWQDRPEVITRMHEAHIFLLTSVTAASGDMEGVPVSLMEAQATGLPVLATSHSGIPEVVIDGKTGFLVPERDVERLTEQLIYLIEHPKIWPELGQNGRKLIEEEYNIMTLSKELEDICLQMTQSQI